MFRNRHLIQLASNPMEKIIPQPHRNSLNKIGIILINQLRIIRQSPKHIQAILINRPIPIHKILTKAKNHHLYNRGKRQREYTNSRGGIIFFIHIFIYFVYRKQSYLLIKNLKINHILQN